jgi:bifunctional DNA-binding transcriptional regulator/antitoxin component of YhaV-PrlF toxin-antitoxin module
MVKHMKKHKVTSGGQVSLPASARNRWKTKAVVVEDLGDRVVFRPLPEDPIAAARGALKALRSTDLRAQARADEADAESRR